MAKIAFITDTHFGSNRGSDVILKSQLKFFREQFIPDLKKKKIDTIIFGGDTFDNRHVLNVNAIHQAIDLFAEDLKDFEIHMIVGNHDLHMRNSSRIHSTRMLNEMDHVTVYNTIEDINLKGLDILMVPWIIDEEYFDSRVLATKAKVCVGHFDIKSFKMTKGYTSEHGLEPEFFSKFDLTLSGHYHFRAVRTLSNKKELHYPGNPYHLNRNDQNDPDRGYAIIDTETLKVAYVNNKVSTEFRRITYPEPFTESDISANIIDVHVEYNGDFEQEKLTEYMELMQSYGPAITPKIVANYNDEFIKETRDEDNYNFTTIDNLLIEYCDGLEDLEDADIIKDRLVSLYNDCKGI